MIVCHEYKYIFLKTRKTAGTSVEIGLSRQCGTKDIITPLSPADEAARAELGYLGAQNYRIPFGRLGWLDRAQALLGRKSPAYGPHIGAKYARARLPARIWSDYTKFTIERNPWDRAVSAYFWRTRDMDPRPPMGEFLQDLSRHRLSNFSIYSIDGTVAVDRILRYEKLTAELESMRIELGLPEPVELPRAKAGHRRDRRGYSELLREEDRALIATACAREIELLGYEFQPTSGV